PGPASGRRQQGLDRSTFPEGMNMASNVIPLDKELSLISLRDKLSGGDSGNPSTGSGHTGSGPAVFGEAYKQLKSRIHLKLLDKVDLAALESLSSEDLRREISALVERLLDEEQAAINEAERATLIRDIQHEMLGFGPLELLM